MAWRPYRALITLAYAVCADETPLRVGSKTPNPGRKKAEKYLLVAATALYTHYLLGDRDLDTFKAFVLKDLTSSVVVHDRYHLYDSAEIGELTHQLCCQHLLRDLASAAETYPEAHWPTQIADALRGLIHQTNLARAAGQATLHDTVRDELITLFRHGVLVGLPDTTSHGNRPGERKPAPCSRPCTTARATCSGLPTTCACHPPPTKPNATCGQPRSNKTSPGG